MILGIVAVRMRNSTEVGGAVRRARPPIAAALAVLGIVALASCGGPREAALPAGSVVLVIGNSITAGVGVTPAEAWPARVAERTGWRVVAAGVSGERTAGGRERLPALLDEHAPALVIIELGGNDMLRGVPAAQIAANLEAMIAAARAHGANVVLMAAPQPSALGALTGFSAAPLYFDVATRMKVSLVDKALPSVLSEPKLKLDLLHPTATGHALLAERTVAELAKIGIARSASE